MTTPTKERLSDGVELERMQRFASLRGNAPASPALDEEARTLTLTFSSEYPVERWFGNEILSHATGAADLSRLNDGAPLLFNHNMDDIIGVVESATIGADRRGSAVVRFARTARGDEMMGLVNDGILRNVSFLYDANDYETETDDPSSYSPDDVYTANRWIVYEISLVTVPADPTIGVGRAITEKTQTVHVETRIRSNSSTTAPATTQPLEIPATQETVQTFARTTAPAATQPLGITMRQNYHPNEQLPADGGSGGTTIINLTQDQMRTAETERQNAIRALGARYKNPDLAMLLVEGGQSIEAARSSFLVAMEGNPQTPVGGARIDLSQKEKRNFSLIRGLQACHSGDWQKAGFEKEVSQTMARLLGRDPTTGGMFLPIDLPFAPDDAHQRAYSMIAGQSRLRMQSRAPYSIGTAATGGALVATELAYDSMIEVMRNAMITPQLGARYITDLVGNIDIPRQISSGSATWAAEFGAGSESEATFDHVRLRPKNLTTWGILSRMMMLQSSPAIEMLARSELLAQMALGLDLAAISGSGINNQPTGLVNQAGVISIVGGVNGKNVDFDDIIKLYTAPRIANAPQASMAFALNSKVIGYLASLKATTGTYLWDPQGGLTAGSPDRIKGKAYGESQQLRSNLSKGTSAGICSELIYGDWMELFFALWGGIELAINPFDSTLFKSGDIVLRAIQTADVGVRHGASFAVMSDALTPGF